MTPPDVAARLRAADLERTALAIAALYGVSLALLLSPRRSRLAVADGSGARARAARAVLWHALYVAGWRRRAIAALVGRRQNVVNVRIAAALVVLGPSSRWPVPPPPPDAPRAPRRHLALVRDGSRFLPGPGDRHSDCRRYATCLDAFVRRTRMRGAHYVADAHCPPRCPARAAIPRHALLAIATQGESPLAQAQR